MWEPNDFSIMLIAKSSDVIDTLEVEFTILYRMALKQNSWICEYRRCALRRQIPAARNLRGHMHFAAGSRHAMRGEQVQAALPIEELFPALRVEVRGWQRVHMHSRLPEQAAPLTAGKDEPHQCISVSKAEWMCKRDALAKLR